MHQRHFCTANNRQNPKALVYLFFYTSHMNCLLTNNFISLNPIHFVLQCTRQKTSQQCLPVLVFGLPQPFPTCFLNALILGLLFITIVNQVHGLRATDCKLPSCAERPLHALHVVVGFGCCKCRMHFIDDQKRQKYYTK